MQAVGWKASAWASGGGTDLAISPKPQKQTPRFAKNRGVRDEAPGSDLLSHGLSHTTIGAGAFHCRVRDGIGWDHAAVSAREAVLQVALLRLACIRTWDVTYDELSHGVDAC